MYTVEDEALRQAAAAGAARAAARAAAGAGEEGSGKEENCKSSVVDEYNILQRFPPLRRRQPRREEGAEGGNFAEAVAAQDEEEEQMVSRALGAVLGSVVGDAAAMGVHWIYAPEELQRLWEARKAGKKKKKEEKQQQNEDQNTAATAAAPLLTTTTTNNKNDNDTSNDEIGLDFYQPPQSPFFSYAHGRPSPYGEQTLLLLHSLHHHRGLHPSLYAQAYAKQYGKGWEGYRDASTKGFLRRWYEEGGGSEGVREGGRWGVRDWQANCFARLPPLVVGFGRGEEAGREGARGGAGGAGAGRGREGGREGERAMLRAVEHATRVTQDDDRAVAWGRGAAVVLARIVFEKQTVEMAMREVAEALRNSQTPLGEEGEGGREGGEGGKEGLKEEVARAFEQVLFLGVGEGRKDVCATVALLGKNCHLPNSLQTAFHAALFYSEGISFPRALSSLPPSPPSSSLPTDAVIQQKQQQQQQQREEKQQLFKRAIRAAIREGGCCGSRAGWAGACLGGWMGIESVPEEWRREVSGFDKIKEEVEEILRQRKRRGSDTN